MSRFNKHGELAIPLPSGGTLCYGGEVRIRDPDDNEIVMWASSEWEEDPEGVMGAIFGAAMSPIDQLLDTLNRTTVEDGCWV